MDIWGAHDDSSTLQMKDCPNEYSSQNNGLGKCSGGLESVLTTLITSEGIGVGLARNDLGFTDDIEFLMRNQPRCVSQQSLGV